MPTIGAPGERPEGRLTAIGNHPAAPRGPGWAAGWIGALTICQLGRSSR
ncbi:hypothetical protein [Streptomyces sp. NPDC051001]